MQPIVSLLVTDVDNTLYDWLRGWAAATRPMLRRLAQTLAVDESIAERQVRDVHRAWGVTECPACAAAIAGGDVSRAIAREYEANFLACRPLYDGVRDTLARIRAHGTRVVAYTESPGAFTRARLRLLGLDGEIDALYARAEQACWTTGRPNEGAAADTTRTRPTAEVAPEAAHVVSVPVERLKPDPSVLRRIAADTGVPLERVLCVGDNLWKDMAMAARARVHAAWARYGTAHAADDLSLLDRLCHWTPDRAAGEAGAPANVAPAIVLERGLAELFDHVTFSRA